MPRVGTTGVAKEYWVPDPTGAGTVVTLAAPTAVQVNTGVRIDTFMRRDGRSIPQSGATIDIADAGSSFNKRGLGTYGGDDAELKLYRDSTSGADTMYPLFKQGLYGFLIVFPFGTAGATPAAADKVEVYRMGIVARENSPRAENDPQIITVKLAILDLNDDLTALA